MAGPARGEDAEIASLPASTGSASVFVIFEFFAVKSPDLDKVKGRQDEQDEGEDEEAGASCKSWSSRQNNWANTLSVASYHAKADRHGHVAGGAEVWRSLGEVLGQDVQDDDQVES